MPYARAHYLVGFVLIVTVIGFWPSYFQAFDKVPLAFHDRALTALSWVTLVLLQSWSIHNRKTKLHLKVGKFSLLMFPFLIVGFVMIINARLARPCPAALHSTSCVSRIV